MKIIIDLIEIGNDEWRMLNKDKKRKNDKSLLIEKWRKEIDSFP
jgi:hypothetical protein